MALIGEMQYLTIGGNTYSLPVGGGGTVTSVAVSNATNGGLSISGSPISSNGTITIGHSNVLTAAQTTQAVYPIKIDKNGHISAYGNAVTIPTKTSDLTNDSGFITLTDVPEEVFVVTITYSNSEYSFNKTFAEIISAYNSGKHIVGHDTSRNTYWYLYTVDESGIEFRSLTRLALALASSGYIYVNSLYLDSTNQVEYTNYELAVPSKTSHLTNDSGFITTETDPVFTASAAAGITSTNITNWNNKQDALVSGTNIKTINNQSLIGSGDIEIQGGANVFIAEYDTTTYAEVKSAYDDDAVIICMIRDNDNVWVLQLTYYDDINDMFMFAEPYGQGCYWASVASDDTWNDGSFSFASTATATTSSNGLMSSSDKTKLNGIASGAEVNVQSNWSQSDSTADDYIKNKPTIPTVNNATLTIQKNGTTVDTFTANASSNVTANITVPTKVSDLNNDSGFVTTDEKLAISESNTAGNSWYPIIGSGTTAKARNYCGNFMFVIGSGVGALPTSIKLGNNQSGNSNSNRYGAIELYGTTEYKTELNSGSPSANRTISLPNNDGTVALTSDLPTVNNATLTIQKNGTTVNTFTANASSNVTANITVPTDTGDLTNGAGFITGVTSTSTPTASTIAEFDASAHMNSTDMTSAEVSDFVDDLNVSPINLIDMFYPVGSYYETSNTSFNPNITWGGTWALETEGQVHVSAGENYEIGGALTNETDGGEATVTLTINEMPSHNHTQNAHSHQIDNYVSSGASATWTADNVNKAHGYDHWTSSAQPYIQPTGGGQAHNNMQPYIVVNRWHRTA